MYLISEFELASKDTNALIGLEYEAIKTAAGGCKNAETAIPAIRRAMGAAKHLRRR